MDTNVLLDFLLDRKPFNDDIAEIIEYSINNSIQHCVSSVTITDTNYIIGRSEGIRSANSKTKRILEIMTVENVGESTVHKSSKSKFKDFEDGVQSFCAMESKYKIIATRNVKDFKESKLALLTPKELLVRMKSWH